MNSEGFTVVPVMEKESCFLGATDSSRTNKVGTFIYMKNRITECGLQGVLRELRAFCISLCLVYCLRPRLGWRYRKHDSGFAGGKRADRRATEW